MYHHYLLRLLIASAIILSYYKYGKSFLIFCAPKVTRYFSLTKYFPVSDIEGTVELTLIAISHVMICIFLLYVLPVHLPVWYGSFAHTKSIYTELIQISIYTLYGILLGIGCMGISGILCKVILQLLTTASPNTQYDLTTWLTMSRGGWIKHHLQSMEILPIYLSLIVLAMQVGSEEIIFRGIFLNYFMPFGIWQALVTSLILFVGMQALLMNRWQSAIFPMIGALVMGLIHSILYLQQPLLWPLIIAHMSFFLFSVL